jgi:two-component system, chemotaxis family, chemotaxis protein CheY
VDITTMLVDDHAEIRTLMRMIITTSGSGVSVACEAASGQEALNIVDDCDPTVIVLDQMMPGLTGLETAERILQRRPTQKMVFCSAYFDDRLRQSVERLGFAAILPKEEITRLPALVREAAGV